MKNVKKRFCKLCGEEITTFYESDYHNDCKVIMHKLLNCKRNKIMHFILGLLSFATIIILLSIVIIYFY